MMQKKFRVFYVMELVVDAETADEAKEKFANADLDKAEFCRILDTDPVE